MPRSRLHTLLIETCSPPVSALRAITAARHDCLMCTSIARGLELCRQRRFEAVICNGEHSDEARFELLTRIHGERPECPVILVGGRPSIRWVRQALKAGAYDVLPEPFDTAELTSVIARATRPGRNGAPSTPRGLALNQKLIEMSGGGDALTGLPGHRAFLEGLSRARSQCRRTSEPLCLVMIDLDRFSELNDTYSRSLGDRVLAWVGQMLPGCLRDGDGAARYRWDRFAVLLPGCNEADGLRLAQRIRERLFSGLNVFDGHQLHVRASLGVAGSAVGFVERERDLIERAEHALTTAKRQGGNQIVAFADIDGHLPTRARLARASVDDVARWIGTSRQQFKRACVESTRALVGTVEAKDPYTRQHSLRVSDYAEVLAQRLNLPAGQREALKTAAILHDIGKIGVPDAILRKPGPLNDEEFDRIKEHPRIAAEILGHATFLVGELPLIRHHHERWDGTGYPDGLAGEKIPFGARVLAVADALDAMSSQRSYKPALRLELVRTELERGAGRQWDRAVTRCALQWLDEEPEALVTG